MTRKHPAPVLFASFFQQTLCYDLTRAQSHFDWLSSCSKILFTIQTTCARSGQKSLVCLPLLNDLAIAFAECSSPAYIKCVSTLNFTDRATEVNTGLQIKFQALHSLRLSPLCMNSECKLQFTKKISIVKTKTICSKTRENTHEPKIKVLYKIRREFQIKWHVLVRSPNRLAQCIDAPPILLFSACANASSTWLHRSLWKHLALSGTHIFLFICHQGAPWTRTNHTDSNCWSGHTRNRSQSIRSTRSCTCSHRTRQSQTFLAPTRTLISAHKRRGYGLTCTRPWPVLSTEDGVLYDAAENCEFENVSVFTNSHFCTHPRFLGRWGTDFGERRRAHVHRILTNQTVEHIRLLSFLKCAQCDKKEHHQMCWGTARPHRLGSGCLDMHVCGGAPDYETERRNWEITESCFTNPYRVMAHMYLNNPQHQQINPPDKVFHVQSPVFFRTWGGRRTFFQQSNSDSQSQTSSNVDPRKSHCSWVLLSWCPNTSMIGALWLWEERVKHSLVTGKAWVFPMEPRNTDSKHAEKTDLRTYIPGFYQNFNLFFLVFRTLSSNW